ncbi:MAG: hypothetical protein KAI79_09865 [Bacteroidales bacterium]|nr:hypothetical protein [Bacteroidales bacterium]
MLSKREVTQQILQKTTMSLMVLKIFIIGIMKLLKHVAIVLSQKMYLKKYGKMDGEPKEIEVEN